jgi:hypothetical protein
MEKNTSGNTNTFEWRINNQATQNANSDQSALILRRAGGTGEAKVDLRAYSGTRIPQFVNGEFMINF